MSSSLGLLESGTRKIRYQTACQTRQKSIPVFLVPVFGADFWLTCHVNKPQKPNPFRTPSPVVTVVCFRRNFFCETCSLRLPVYVVQAVHPS